jgi:hypothetical protein
MRAKHLTPFMAPLLGRNTSRSQLPSKEQMRAETERLLLDFAKRRAP